MAHNSMTKKYRSELGEIDGKPGAYEKFMSLKSWMWRVGNNKILLNSDSRKKTTKISYIYIPLYAQKYEDEVKVKLKGKPYDPVHDTFLK